MSLFKVKILSLIVFLECSNAQFPSKSRSLKHVMGSQRKMQHVQCVHAYSPLPQLKCMPACVVRGKYFALFSQFRKKKQVCECQGHGVSRDAYAHAHTVTHKRRGSYLPAFSNTCS